MNNGVKFSTKDQDNDIWGSNCAAYYGAWWYYSCGRRSELNASLKSQQKLRWDNRSYNQSTMMIRKIYWKTFKIKKNIVQLLVCITHRSSPYNIYQWNPPSISCSSELLTNVDIIMFCLVKIAWSKSEMYFICWEYLKSVLCFGSFNMEW